MENTGWKNKKKNSLFVLLIFPLTFEVYKAQPNYFAYVYGWVTLNDIKIFVLDSRIQTNDAKDPEKLITTSCSTDLIHAELKRAYNALALYNTADIGTPYN